MSTKPTPRNRKERRAAAKEGRNADADSVPMAQPDRTRPKGRTLFDIAAEKEAELRNRRSPAFSGVAGDTGEPTVVTINADGSLSGPDGEPLPADMSARVRASMAANESRINNGNESGGTAQPSGIEDEDEDDIGALYAEAALYTVTLCLLHFTFNVLVTHQYGLSEQLRYWRLAWQSISYSPVLAVVVFMLHPKANSPWAQALFLTMSITAGCWLIHATTNMPYMAVMKRAPGVGTVWIWSTLESRAEIALLGAVAVGGFFWYGQYSIYD